MDINKKKGNNWYYYGCYDGKTYIYLHGLYNYKDIYMGYYYHDKQKGFWVGSYKR